MDINNPDIIKILQDHLDYSDHPIYVDKDDVQLLFDNLKSQWWAPSLGHNCSFCNENAHYFNSMTDMWACESCMGDFMNGEIDLIHPEDHELSLYLRKLLCNWIDTHYFGETSSSDLFDECSYNTCYVCNIRIESGDDNVAIADNAHVMAHVNCVQSVGFRNLYTEEEYNNILRDLLSDDEDERINKGFKNFCEPALYKTRSDITRPTITKRAK